MVLVLLQMQNQDMLAICWSLIKCRHWVLGYDGLEVVTDHSALVQVFSKDCSTITNPRLRGNATYFHDNKKFCKMLKAKSVSKPQEDSIHSFFQNILKSYALSFYRSEIILDRENCFGQAKSVLFEF